MGLLNTIFSISPKSSLLSDLENPSLWNGHINFGRKTTSGETVTEGNSFTLSAYWAGIRAISEDIAKLPLIMYERQKPRGRIQAIDHSVFSIVNDNPNPEMTSITFWETLYAWALSHGNGYAEIEIDNRGELVALWPIHPSRVQPKRDKKGKIIYEVQTGDIFFSPSQNFKSVIFQSEEIFHLHGLGATGLAGYSVLSFASEALGLGLAAQKYGASFFGNGANLGGILTTPEKLKQKAKESLREQWERAYSGSGNAHRTAVLEGDMKWVKIGVPPNEAQFLETREFAIEDIARFLRIPPSMIGHLKDTSFSSLENHSRTYFDFTLSAWTVRGQKEMARKLLFEDEKEKFFFEFDPMALIRGDSKTRAEFYRKLFGLGALSPNDIREKESMNPIENGDKYFLQQNLTTIDNVVNGTIPGKNIPKAGPKESEDGDRNDRASVQEILDNQTPVIESAAERVIRKEVKAVTRALVKFTGSKSGFEQWMEGFHADQKEYIIHIFDPLMKSIFNFHHSNDLEEMAEEFTIHLNVMAISFFDNDLSIDSIEGELVSNLVDDFGKLVQNIEDENAIRV